MSTATRTGVFPACKSSNCYMSFHRYTKIFKSPVHYSSNSLACFPLLKLLGIYKIMEIYIIKHQTTCLVCTILICICIDKLWSSTNMTSFAGFEKGSESILLQKSEKHEIQSWIPISMYNVYLILKVDIGFSFQERLYHMAVVCLCSSTKWGACSLCKSQSTVRQYNYKIEAKLDFWLKLMAKKKTHQSSVLFTWSNTNLRPFKL